MILAAVAQAVLHQVGHDLRQLSRIHAGCQRAGADVDMNRLIGRCGTAKFSDKVFQPGFQIEQFGLRFASARQLQDIFDDLVNASRLLMNDLAQASIRCTELFRFIKQLSRMTDGAQRVAYLMGNPGGQASQCGELELLRLMGDLRQVFEKTSV